MRTYLALPTGLFLNIKGCLLNLCQPMTDFESIERGQKMHDASIAIMSMICSRASYLHAWKIGSNLWDGIAENNIL